ncbi:hypothetical protein [Candidatus Symbiopectobacterium sp.]|uniref:hypothetical protein n=1 Tax=Candidatus Symbiopectobacterium sp. TaxID=2816440 RepID=UPI0025C0941F|nr:hypothetical protein [Candidatus Symbiopectobacterium sp.]
MLNPERGDASRSDQHFNPKQACHNSIIPYYSTKPHFLPKLAWQNSMTHYYSTKPILNTRPNKRNLH